ncbi:MAG: hypothetical protein WCR52_00505 [Bacteroidota bacterium]
MRCAVIDLGTNTFHLLITDRDAQGVWQPILRQKVYVKLADEGIHRIGAAAFERGLAALQGFSRQLAEYEVPLSAVKAFGTAALRTAENASEFLAEAARLTGIQGEVISGDREAQLIYTGVRLAVPFPEGKVLIMDIGGGSVEFIIADHAQVYWQQSFPIGVAVLFRNFHKNDPVHADEIKTLEDFLETALHDLWHALEQFPAKTLIGASGTFDVIDLFLLDPAEKPETYGVIEKVDFEPFYLDLIRSTLAERLAMDRLPEERAEMVVVALILVRYILHKTGIDIIFTSTYAMKEGMLEEISKANP